MNVSITCIEPELTDCIERNRASIVALALDRSLRRDRHTVMADAIANRTIDYLIWAIADADEQPLLDWVGTSLQKYVRDQSLFDILAATVSASLDLLVRDFGHVARSALVWLESIQRRIDLTVGASRLEFRDERFSLDSVDAKIDEVLYRLSQRDTLTAEHSRAVGLWCWRIAKKLGLSREETLLATRSGSIHDIGKTTTPLEILTAPRSLDADEWEIMRLHTMEGVKIVETIPELSQFVSAVRWHHERMDGTGYPDGLASSEIPLQARIVAVADAFNAMVARRPYRQPRSPSNALEELKRNSGSHFDPSIVAAMIDVVLQ